MNNYTLHITYKDSIRSKDLENILSGIRLLCQRGMAKKTGLHLRKYTDCFRITTVENGSIIVNLTLNIGFDIDLLECIKSAIEIYISSIPVEALIKTAINGIKAALNHGNEIHIRKNDIQIDVPGNYEGEIIIDENGAIRLTTTPNNPNNIQS